ncbi:MAG: hypothetical protein ACODAB_03065 [Gemmatimonadota bacterium]
MPGRPSRRPAAVTAHPEIEATYTRTMGWDMEFRTFGRMLLTTLAAAATPMAPEPLSAQSIDSDTVMGADGAGTGSYGHMHMLLERTIFKVDVLTLDVRLGPSTADRIEELLTKPGESAGLSDSVAVAALEANDVLARIEFHRDLGLERFLDGIRDNLRRATRAGFVTPAQFRRISDDLPHWYSALADRGIRSGDRMYQRVRSDTLRTVYVGADGDVLLDQVDVGPERRLAVLGGYFAPGSDFREGLVASVLDARDVD